MATIVQEPGCSGVVGETTALPGRTLPGVTYLLPLRVQAPDDDLARYLTGIVRLVDVLVVDGSPDDVRAASARRWPPGVRHVVAPPVPPGTNGKVVAVNHGLRVGTEPRVVVADDDVRHTPETLAAVVRRLDRASAVRPQNYFSPAPWHAVWDEARTLLNRALASDYPGTLAFRRDALGDEGYDPHVLFENLELLRTVQARGGTVDDADDVLVPRRPCRPTHFLRQRVRQAYDSHAQPLRLLAELALAPLLALNVRRGRRLLVTALAAMALAEAGRRRDGARAAFRVTSSVLAPLWLLERATTSWIALALRATGGCPYAGRRIPLAAHSVRALARSSRTSTAAVPHL